MLAIYDDNENWTAQLVSIADTFKMMSGRANGNLLRNIRRISKTVEDEMRANHVWQNRTGTAEKTLYVKASRVSDGTINVEISHGPEVKATYGIFLENMSGGKFAIIPYGVELFQVLLEEYIQKSFIDDMVGARAGVIDIEDSGTNFWVKDAGYTEHPYYNGGE